MGGGGEGRLTGKEEEKEVLRKGPTKGAGPTGGLTGGFACAPQGKPAPDVYLEAMRRLGPHVASEPHRVLVVEDAVNGLRAARCGRLRRLLVEVDRQNAPPQLGWVDWGRSLLPAGAPGRALENSHAAACLSVPPPAPLAPPHTLPHVAPKKP